MKRARKVEELSIPQPAMAPFIDVTFQLLIFFMLTIKFKQVEGHLLSMLPKIGMAPTEVPIEPDEVRMYICGDPNGRMDQHIGVKESHQDHLLAHRQAGQPVGDVCRLQIELNADGYSLYRTERWPSKAQENRRIYRDAARRTATIWRPMRASIPIEKRCPVVIDSDGLSPYEHAFGLLNALQKEGVHEIEFAGNPRFDRYYGPTK